MKLTNQNRDRSEALLRATGRYDADEPIQNPTREWCKSQIGRLLGKPFSPTVPEAISELIDTLMQYAESPDHAKRIADHFASTTGPCPEPAVLKERARQTSGIDFAPEPMCDQCAGCGWIVVGLEDGSQGRAKKCTCWKERPIMQTPWQQGRVKEVTEIPAAVVDAHRIGGAK